MINNVISDVISSPIKNIFGAGFLPSDLPNLKLWTRFNQGITVTGSGVSQWDDQSGNGNHLKQGIDTNRPSEEADGSILFDGVDNFLKADAFTLAQPETIYLLAKQITWTANDTIFDGNTNNTGRLYDLTATPRIGCFAGDLGAESDDFILDTYNTVSVVFDHDNSSNILQIGNNTPVIDVAFGISDMGGFALGANGGATNFSNIQVKEALIYSEAHDAATRAKVISYLSGVGGL